MKHLIKLTCVAWLLLVCGWSPVAGDGMSGVARAIATDTITTDTITTDSTETDSAQNEHAQDEPGQNELEKIEFYGRVLDEAGRGVANCQVTFSAPWRERWERLAAYRHVDREEAATMVVATDAAGNYRASIDLSDTRWLGPGEGAIMAFSPATGLAIQAYRLDRSLVDLPLDLVLHQRTTTPVVLQDDSGTPIAGARVTPVRFGNVSLPRQLGERFAATTDAAGMADVVRPGLDLTAVLVEPAGEFHAAVEIPSGGNSISYRSVQAAAGGPQVVTLPRPRQRTLRIQHLDPAQTANLPAITWIILSYQPVSNGYDATWQTLRTAAGENTATINLPSGSLQLLTDASSGHGLFSSYRQSSETLAPESDEVLAVLEPGLLVTGSVVSAKDGSPLPGITLQHFGNHHVLSQADGSFTAWLPRISDGFYPLDPLQRYYSPDAFFERPNAESSPGRATVRPFQLVASDRIRGKVLLADGQPAVGLTIHCESKKERFTTSQTILSDRHGAFTIYGLQAGTPVKLTVADRRGVTESPIQLSLDPQQPITIQLAPASPVRFLGQVLDDAGRPVANVAVTVHRGVVSIDNGYQPIEYTGMDAFGTDAAAAPTVFMTDHQGHFHSPECFDFKHPFAVTVEHPEHFAKRTSFRTFPREASHAYDFGHVVMRGRSAAGSVNCLVQDREGQPVAGASVILVQPGSFAGQQFTGVDGTASFAAMNCAGVIGVYHADLGVSFLVYRPAPIADPTAGDATSQAAAAEGSPVVITLDQQHSAAPWPTESVDRRQRRALARKLLERFDFAKQPDLDKVSSYEASVLLGAMAFTSPASAVTYAIGNVAELIRRPDVGISFVMKVVEREPNLVQTLMPAMPDSVRSGILTERAADATAEESQRRRDIEESLTIARGMSGDDAAVAFGRIAMLLLELGDVEAATYIIEEFFADYRNEALSASGQRSKRGVARYFYPQLALVDFELSCKLIREQAYPNEIESLHALALVLAVVAGQTTWESGLESFGPTLLKQSESSLVPGAFGRTPLPSLQFVEQLGNRLTDPKCRGQLWMNAAMRTPGCSAVERAELLQRGLAELAGHMQPPDSLYFKTLAYEWKKDWKALQRIDPALARWAIFLCFRELSTHRDGQHDYLAQRTTLVAQALAQVAPDASRVLLTPFVEDLTWRLSARDIGTIEPLGVAAEIDPAWATQIAEQLMDGEFRTDRLRQLLVLDSLLAGLAKP
jgi:hypothetical protein